MPSFFDDKDKMQANTAAGRSGATAWNAAQKRAAGGQPQAPQRQRFSLPQIKRTIPPPMVPRTMQPGTAPRPAANPQAAQAALRTAMGRQMQARPQGEPQRINPVTGQPMNIARPASMVSEIASGRAPEIDLTPGPGGNWNPNDPNLGLNAEASLSGAADTLYGKPPSGQNVDIAQMTPGQVQWSPATGAAQYSGTNLLATRTGNEARNAAEARSNQANQYMGGYQTADQAFGDTGAYEANVRQRGASANQAAQRALREQMASSGYGQSGLSGRLSGELGFQNAMQTEADVQNRLDQLMRDKAGYGAGRSEFLTGAATGLRGQDINQQIASMGLSQADEEFVRNMIQRQNEQWMDVGKFNVGEANDAGQFNTDWLNQGAMAEAGYGWQGQQQGYQNERDVRQWLMNLLTKGR